MRPRCVIKRVVQARTPAPPGDRGQRRHAEPAELPVGARHVDHRGVDAAGAAPPGCRCPRCWCRRWRCPAWCLACTTRATCSPAWRSGRSSPRRSARSQTGSKELMSISSESSAESAPKMSEEPAPVKGPPQNLATGIIKALRPRQWVKNLLVFARPGGRAGQRRPTTTTAKCGPGADRVRRVQPGRIVRLSGQRRARRRGRPRAPDQTVPPDRRGRGARMAGLRAGRGARRRVAGDLLAGDAEPGVGDRRSTSRSSWPTASASNTRP